MSTKAAHRPIRAYSCGPYGTVVHATDASKARYQYWLHAHDAYPSLKLTDIRVLSLGRPIEQAGFRENAEYRGIEFARVGMRVTVWFGGKYNEGRIVGHNASANLDVEFEDGQVLNCHPHSDGITYYDDAGNVIRDFRVAKPEVQS